jgi:hypothetical protein
MGDCKVWVGGSELGGGGWRGRLHNKSGHLARDEEDTVERGGEGAQSPTEEKDVGHQARRPVVAVHEKNHTLREAMCARTQSERAVRSRNHLDAFHMFPPCGCTDAP